MAEAEGSANGVNGASLSREQAYAADKAAFLAEMSGEAIEAPAETKPTKAAAKASAKADPDLEADEPEVEASADDDDDLDVDEPEIDEEAEDEPDEDADDGADPDKSKRLDAVRRREQRSREAIAKERRAFEQERDSFVAEWKPRIEAAERFESMKGRGVNAYNAVDVLRELGMPDDDFEEAGRAIFAVSKTGAADPKNKEAIARNKREREQAEEIRELRKRLDERDSSEKKQAAEAANAREVERFIDGIAKSAPAGTPSADWLEREPAKTRAHYARLAEKLWERTGARPTAKAVHAAYNKWRTNQLRSLGVDVSAAKSGAKTVTANGAKKGAKADEDRPLTRDEYVSSKFD